MRKKHSSPAIIIDRSAEINTSFNIYLNIAVAAAVAVVAAVIINFLYEISSLGWFNKAKYVGVMISDFIFTFVGVKIR